MCIVKQLAQSFILVEGTGQCVCVGGGGVEVGKRFLFLPEMKNSQSTSAQGGPVWSDTARYRLSIHHKASVTDVKSIVSEKISC